MADLKKPEAAEAAAKPEEDHVKFWVGELEASAKREKGYRRKARKIIDIYEAEEDTSEVPYNILYSNTETLSPALYNTDPRLDTRPRSKAPNAVADAAAGLVDSYLTTFIDSGDARYAPFSECVQGAVLQALVPGRGIVRFHYKAVTENGEDGAPARVTDESVFCELIDWDKVRFGFAKSWAAVPWVAFMHTWTREEAEAELGPETAGKLTYLAPGDSEDDAERKPDPDETASVATCAEIWHRTSKKVYWVEPNGLKTFLKEATDDPYKLQGFYPIPQPLQFFQRISSFIPKPLYVLYEQQAAELNRITIRISKLIDAMKIRGFFDSTVEGLEKLFDSDENTLIALTTLASLGQGAKADNAIWLVPIEKHVTVLQQLIQNRQQIKQVIYDIMGIADIMRGSSVASETLGAQELKNKWGTLRLKRHQKAVACFVRDGLRIAAELGLTLLSNETLRQMTGSTLPPQADMDQLEMQAQMGGAPMPPEAQAKMALPTFEETLTLCRHDVLRRYVIDIETNSTIDAEASEDKEDMAAFLTALGQFLNGLVPLLEKGMLPQETLKGVMTVLARRFRMGRDLDPYFQKIGQGQPGPGVQAKQLEEKGKQLAEGQKKLQAEGQKVSAEGQKLQKERQQLEKDRMAFELQQAQSQVQTVIKELQTKVKDAKARADLEGILLKISTAAEKFAAQQAVAAAKEKAEEAAEPAEASGD